jgi:hypothetical protein
VPPPVPAPERSSNTGLLVGIAVGALVLLLAVGGAGWYVFSRRTPPATATDASGLSGTAGTTPGAGTTPASSLPAPATTTADTETPAPAAPADAPTSAPGQPARAGDTTAPVAPRAATGGGTPATAAPPEAGAPAAPPPARTADARFRYLDEEPQADGREAGERAAAGYRNGQGYTPSGSYGTSRRFAQRERSPRDLAVAERPAVATLRHLMDREEAYKKSTGRYGTFAEMARAGGFALDVPVSATAFNRKGYRFELTVEEDGFRITAVPGMPGPRSFLGDDTGFIRAGLD